MQNHLKAKISNGEARQVFRQFAWNLASGLKSPKTSRTRNIIKKVHKNRGKNK
jgi:hypothetical protein